MTSKKPVSCGCRWRSPKTARMRDVRLPNVPSHPRHSTSIEVNPTEPLERSWGTSPVCLPINPLATAAATVDLPTPWQPHSVTRRRALAALPGTPPPPLPSNHRVSCCSSASRPISGDDSAPAAAWRMFDPSSGTCRAARNQITKRRL